MNADMFMSRKLTFGLLMYILKIYTMGGDTKWKQQNYFRMAVLKQ